MAQHCGCWCQNIAARWGGEEGSPEKTAPLSDLWRQMAPEVQVLLLPCHMTTERHGEDPGGCVSLATWHVAAVKIVAGSSERVAGRRRQQQKNRREDGWAAEFNS